MSRQSRMGGICRILFPIPMRGNERYVFAAAALVSLFPIPMRGNEAEIDCMDTTPRTRFQSP